MKSANFHRLPLKFQWLTMLLLILLIFSACRKDSSNDNISRISFEVPPGFPDPVYRFQNNALTDQRFELGRKLFYDPLLSRNNTISCGSCHLQAGAFSHIDHKVSHGIDDLNGTRNSPPLFNLAWQQDFFWDGGVNHIEVQPIAPIQNPVEMDETLENVLVKLNASTEYRALFFEAYGSDTIDSQMMLRAFAQYMSVLISSNSRYDKFINGTAGGNFTAQEENGLKLFRTKCASCHTEPLFTDMQFRNNGLDMIFTNDPGRSIITGDPADDGKFKVPSLRNVEVSYPYMHDGRIKTLEKVLDHYSSGIQASATLDPKLAGGNIPLSASEKTDIIKFLRTLTDHKFLHDSRFSAPN